MKMLENSCLPPVKFSSGGTCYSPTKQSGKGCPKRLPVAVLLLLLVSCCTCLSYSTLTASSHIHILQDNTISGTVKNAEGQTLSGVTVRVQGASHAVMTNDKGFFSLKSDSLPVLLEFSFVGYERKVQLISKAGNQQIVLQSIDAALDDIVVIGYGEVKKKDLTGSIVNVNMEELKNEPVTSIDLALQGRVPGADIMATTGEPGATTTIRIRGTRSITATNEPLIVVDGVIDGISNLNDINPSDIATISVLKDASATAIYGSRGSNGVIIITTKEGKKGKTNITLRNIFGLAQLPRKLDIMNAAQFAQFRNDYAYFATSDGYGDIGPYSPQSAYPYPDPLSMGTGTDWVKEITRTAPYHTHLLSLSGGGDKVKYYGSVGFDNNQGIIKKSGLTRLTARLNLDYQLFKWGKIGYKYNFSNIDQDQNLVTVGGASWWSGAIFLNPLIKPKSNFNDLWYSGQKFNSPLAILNNDVVRNLKKNSSTNTVYMEIEPVKNLKLNSQLNYYSYARHTFQFDPGTLPAKAEGEGARAYRAEYTSHNLMSQTTLNYFKDWNKTHHMDFTLGLIGEKTSSDNLTLTGEGYQSDFIKWNNMNAIPDKENYSAASGNTSKTTLSYLARFNYNYKSKYYATITGRRDGSSNFAIDDKWAFFLPQP